MTRDALRRQVLAWNDTRRVLPYGESLLHEAIVARSRRTPSRVAAIDGTTTVTDAEIERQSGALARLLRREGVRAEVPVGVCSRRSAAVVSAFVGILRAGGAYVPLDPAYPAERLAFMIRDAGVRIVLVEPGTHVAFPPGVRLLELAGEAFAGSTIDDAPVVARDNLAYVMYTSGSTGVPKGVMITHGAMANTIGWMQEAYPLESDDVVAHKTSISFTDSIWELLWPPLVGARIAVIGEHDARFPRLLLQRLQEQAVTVTQFVPAQMRLFVDEAARAEITRRLPRLRWAFNGGEALPPSLARDWLSLFPHTRIANAYGMTESAIYATNFVVAAADDDAEVRVGRPIANERAYVLDSSGELCEPGVIGEIHLAGESLARGYLRRPELSAASFVPDPFGPPGSVMYRTGDLGRFCSNGEIVCLGRLDRQVKIRGARIEMGDVEAALAQHPEVRQALVMARRAANDNELDAYYTWRTSDPGVCALVHFLRDRVPEHMIPARLIGMEQFPLTVNGKCDRRRLAETAHN